MHRRPMASVPDRIRNCTDGNQSTSHVRNGLYTIKYHTITIVRR